MNWYWSKPILHPCSWSLDKGVASTINQGRTPLTLEKAALWPLLIHSCWSFNLDLTEITAEQLSELQPCLCTAFYSELTSTSSCSPPSSAAFCSPSTRQFLAGPKTFDFSPRWWAEPETLVASPGLSRSGWRQAWSAGCSDSSQVTSSWDAPRNQHTCNLMAHRGKSMNVRTRLSLVLYKNT